MRPRLALTTTYERASELADQVAAQGLDPVILPCIEVRALGHAQIETARRLASRADRLIITSPRTISILWPDGGMPAVPVAVVGERTAKAVETAGGRPDVVGHGGADQLLERLTEDDMNGKVVFPKGTAARHQLPGVEAVDVYETRALAPAGESVDGVVFGSPSAVDGWLSSRDLVGLVVGAIGSTTADELERRGRQPDVIPERPGYEPTIELMAGILTNRSLV